MSVETRLKMSLSHKGKKPNRKAPYKKWSEQEKKQISERMKGSKNHRFGKPVSIETRKKLSNSLKGEKNKSWKGGKTQETRRLRRSLEYRLWRESVFRRDDWTCVFCRARGTTLNADHIKPWALFPELRFAIDNGRTLCVDCHKKTDTWGWKSSRYYVKC